MEHIITSHIMKHADTHISPFLNTGQMFAVFHMAGIVPDSNDILNMTVSIGAMNADGTHHYQPYNETC
jgi:hypothetical protein